MNSQLVDQCRERAKFLRTCYLTADAKLLTEAADEIERLVADTCGLHGITIAQLTESRGGQHVE